MEKTKKARKELLADIENFIEMNDGIYQLERPFSITVDGRKQEIQALVQKFSYYNNNKNVITNLVGLAKTWNTVEAYDIDDYCDEKKLQELYDNLHGIKEKMREGFILLKFENGVVMPPEVFDDALTLAGRMKELAGELKKKCNENGFDTYSSFGEFGSNKIETHYRQYVFKTPASDDTLYLTYVANNNSKSNNGFGDICVSREKGDIQEVFNDNVADFVEYYQDAVVAGDTNTSLVCTHGNERNKMYTAGYYVTKEDNSVESHIANYVEIKFNK